MKWPAPLDTASLAQKLVREGRGGYCYEQNLLFAAGLRALGFPVTGLAARVKWAAPAGTIRPRTHRLLRVDVDGAAYAADVGFGGSTPTAPLRLEAGLEQRTPHERFRLTKAESEFVLDIEIEGGWMPLYQFGETEQLLPDYEVANWYVSTHPKSQFVTTLLAARPAPGVRYALRDTQFTIHRVNGATEGRTLASAAEVRATLENVFGLTLPRATEFDERLRRLVREQASGGTADGKP